jgi:hypothetical protein
VKVKYLLAPSVSSKNDNITWAGQVRLSFFPPLVSRHSLRTQDVRPDVRQRRPAAGHPRHPDRVLRHDEQRVPDQGARAGLRARLPLRRRALGRGRGADDDGDVLDDERDEDGEHGDDRPERARDEQRAQRRDAQAGEHEQGQRDERRGPGESGGRGRGGRGCGGARGCCGSRARGAVVGTCVRHVDYLYTIISLRINVYSMQHRLGAG